MKKALIFVVIWLVVVNLFGLLALNRINVAPDTSYPWVDPIKTKQEQSWNILDLHRRWDSNWYWSITEKGYEYKGPLELSNIVFFPVYPMLVRLLSIFMFGNFLLAAWVVSVAALIGAVMFLFKLVKQFEPKADALQTIGFLLIFPTAFFFNAIYTESLFLFFSIATFYFVFKKNFWAAGTLAGLASLTRVTGVLLFMPLLIEYFRQNKSWKLDKKILPLFLSPFGTLVFFTYHYFAFGDFFAFFKVEKAWGRAFQFNQDHFHLFTQAATANFLLDALFVAVIITLIYFVGKKLRLSYAVYMLLTVLVALSTGTFMSIGRYIVVLFPMYIFASSIRNVNVKQAWAFSSTLLLALNIILFVHFYWAG